MQFFYVIYSEDVGDMLQAKYVLKTQLVLYGRCNIHRHLMVAYVDRMHIMVMLLTKTLLLHITIFKLYFLA